MQDGERTGRNGPKCCCEGMRGCRDDAVYPSQACHVPVQWTSQRFRELEQQWKWKKARWEKEPIHLPDFMAKRSLLLTLNLFHFKIEHYFPVFYFYHF